MTDAAADAPTPVPATPPPPGRLRLAGRLLIALVVLGGAAGTLWYTLGQSFLKNYQDYQRDLVAVEESIPIGYEGIAYRRTYNDRPPVFHFEKEGRKLLWASVGRGDGPTFYDVTDAAFEVQAVEGGFGKDSIPGIDYPILEFSGGRHATMMPDRLACFGALLKEGPRAYPEALLRKVEVVNDEDGTTPIVVVFDRSIDRAGLYARTIDGQAVTFGTTGYSVPKTPLLYDRKTEGLWLPAEDALECVNGPLKGTKLPRLRPLTRTTWGEWRDEHPKTEVLVGSNRPDGDPIPEE